MLDNTYLQIYAVCIVNAKNSSERLTMEQELIDLLPESGEVAFDEWKTKIAQSGRRPMSNEEFRNIRRNKAVSFRSDWETRTLYVQKVSA